jgi:hypothetical protein
MQSSSEKLIWFMNATLTASRLLETTPNEMLLDQAKNDQDALKVLISNGLIEDERSEKFGASLGGTKRQEKDQFNISLDSLLKVLSRYDIPPAACSHIRGQEQIFGTRMLRDEEGNVKSFGMLGSRAKYPRH